MMSDEINQDILISEITLVVDKMLPSDWKNQRTNRPYHGLINVSCGAIRCTFSDGTEYLVPAGEILYLPKGTSYWLSAEGEEHLEYFIVNFALERDDDLLNAMLMRHIVPLNIIKSTERFEHLNDLYFNTPSGYRVEMLACLYRILCDALSASQRHLLSGDGRRIMPAVQYLRDNCTSECVLTDAADLCHLSVSHLRRLFHSYYGMTPKKYVILLRISNAKRLLTSTVLPIYEVAEQCGFTDSAYFCKIFHRETGTTPNAYRKSGGIDEDG